MGTPNEIVCRFARAGRLRAAPTRIIVGLQKSIFNSLCNWNRSMNFLEKFVADAAPAPRSQLDLLVLHHLCNGRTLEHPVLERGVVLELAHRQLAADAPGVEHEAVGIDDRVLVGEPLAP